LGKNRAAWLWSELPGGCPECSAHQDSRLEIRRTVLGKPAKDIWEIPVESQDNDQDPDELLICMRDNVSASPEDPQCSHPSSACPFRELCPIREAMRRNRAEEAARNADVEAGSPPVSRRRKKP
jgi:hypothetical protein